MSGNRSTALYLDSYLNFFNNVLIFYLFIIFYFRHMFCNVLTIDTYVTDTCTNSVSGHEFATKHVWRHIHTGHSSCSGNSVSPGAEAAGDRVAIVGLLQKASSISRHFTLCK